MEANNVFSQNDHVVKTDKKKEVQGQNISIARLS